MKKLLFRNVYLLFVAFPLPFASYAQYDSVYAMVKDDMVRIWNTNAAKSQP